MSVFEELHSPLMLFRLLACREGAKVPSFAGAWIHFA
jgi:hypothetical protein